MMYIIPCSSWLLFCTMYNFDLVQYKSPHSGRTVHYSEEDVGKVVFYDTRSGKKQTLVPVLIASPGQCPEFVSTNPGEVIVRSFKSGKL